MNVVLGFCSSFFVVLMSSYELSLRRLLSGN